MLNTPGTTEEGNYAPKQNLFHNNLRGRQTDVENNVDAIALDGEVQNRPNARFCRSRPESVGVFNMWFKNLRVYRLTKAFDLSAEALAEALSSKPFTPCGKQDVFSSGWVSPLGRHGKMLVHTTNGNMMICAKRQEKVLPAAVVNEHLDEKVSQISQQEGRSVSRTERTQLKEEIYFSLLPQALSKSQTQFAYISPDENWIIINASSAKKAEDLLGLLRDAVGSLAVIPFATKNQPTQSMTHWLEHSELPQGFILGDECELEAPKDDGRTVRCKKQDLTAAEVINHLHTGMLVKKLALIWQDNIEFIIDHELGIKRVKFSEELLDKVNERHPESAAEEFDLDFNIMSLELKGLLKALTSAFGGLNLSRAIAEDDD